MHWYDLQRKTNIKCSAVHATIFCRWNESSEWLVGDWCQSVQHQAHLWPVAFGELCQKLLQHIYTLWLLWLDRRKDSWKQHKSFLRSSQSDQKMLLFLGNDLQFRMASLANVGLFGPKKFHRIETDHEGARADGMKVEPKPWSISQISKLLCILFGLLGSLPCSNVKLRKEGKLCLADVIWEQGPSSRGNRLSSKPSLWLQVQAIGFLARKKIEMASDSLSLRLTDVYGKTKEGPKHPKTSEKTTANPTWVSWSSHFLKCCRLGNANEKSLAISAMNTLWSLWLAPRKDLWKQHIITYMLQELLAKFAKSSCNIYVAFINPFSGPATVMRKCFSFLLITFSFAWLRWRMRWMLASSGPRNFNLNSSSHSLNSNRPRRCRGGRDESEGGGGSRVDFSIFKACTAAIAAFFLASSAVLPAMGSKCLSPTSSSASQQNSVSRTWYESRQGPSSRGNRLSSKPSLWLQVQAIGFLARKKIEMASDSLSLRLTDVYGKTKEGPKHPKTSEKTTANPTWVSWSSHFLKCCRLGATQTRNHWPSARWEMPCKHGIALLLSKTFQLPDMEWNWNSMSFRIGQFKSLSLPDPDCAACPHQTHNWHTLAP